MLLCQHTAPEPLLTTQQAAWLLRISRKTLERMRVEDRGPRFVKLGRCVRYRQRNLLTWITINTHQTSTKPPRSSEHPPAALPF